MNFTGQIKIKQSYKLTKNKQTNKQTNKTKQKKQNFPELLFGWILGHVNHRQPKLSINQYEN